MHIQGGGEHNRARSILPNYNTKLAVRETGERSVARRFDPLSGGILPITALPPLWNSALNQVLDSPTLPRAIRNDTERQSSLTSNSSHTINTPNNVANWRHGDIKPDNILRFVDSSSNDQITARIGTLKLADLGRAKVNYYATMFRQMSLRTRCLPRCTTSLLIFIPKTQMGGRSAFLDFLTSGQ
jgi:hypothetical protein